MTTSTQCPACGAPATGKFCSKCGASLAAGGCKVCGSVLPKGVKFCPACGAPASGMAAVVRGRGDRTPWIIAAVAIVGLLAALLIIVSRSSSGRAPDSLAAPTTSAPLGTDGMPDLSAMTPRERFDRLYNRVMRAAEGGDPSTVTNFGPMALQAYAMLGDEDRDADARYHAAMIYLHTGGAEQAVALADTIQAQVPTHLFGYVIRGTAAKLANDQAALSQAYAEYLKDYDAEMTAGRTEYGEHPAILELFREEALAAGK